MKTCNTCLVDNEKPTTWNVGTCPRCEKKGYITEVGPFSSTDVDQIYDFLKGFKK